jgi:hypothetical protein
MSGARSMRPSSSRRQRPASKNGMTMKQAMVNVNHSRLILYGLIRARLGLATFVPQIV